MRTMAEYEQPLPARIATGISPRVMLQRAALLHHVGRPALAHATNGAQRFVAGTLSALQNQHGSRCSCCSGMSNKKSRKTARERTAPRAFPAPAEDDFALV